MNILLNIFFSSLFVFSEKPEIPQTGKFTWTLEEAQDVEFIRGNTILFDKGTEVEYDNGQLRYISVFGYALETSQWKTPSGRVLPLYCGAVPLSLRGKLGQAVNSPQMNDPQYSPLIWFHDNGEYMRGCHALTTFDIEGDVYNLKAGIASMISLHDDGELAYLSSIHSGAIIFNNQNVKLKPRTEVFIYKNKKPNFFTPERGQLIKMSTPRYGEVLFSQANEKTVSWSLFEDGHIERGILGADFKLKNYTISKGEGINFYVCRKGLNRISGNFGSYEICDLEDKVPYVDAVVLSEVNEIKTKDDYTVKTKFIVFYQSGALHEARLENSFKYTDQSGKVIPLQKNDSVIFNEDLEIVDYILRWHGRVR